MVGDDKSMPTPTCPMSVKRMGSYSQQSRCKERQNDEIEVLESIFPGQVSILDVETFKQQNQKLNQAHKGDLGSTENDGREEKSPSRTSGGSTLSPPHRAFCIHLASTTEKSTEFDLFVVMGELYPLEPPRLAVTGINEPPLDEIWELVAQKRGLECIFEVCQMLLDCIEKCRENDVDISDNLWDAYKLREAKQLQEQEELLREKKLQTLADKEKQEKKLKEEVEDMRKRPARLMESPKIPHLNFLPADPDCASLDATSFGATSPGTSPPSQCTKNRGSGLLSSENSDIGNFDNCYRSQVKDSIHVFENTAFDGVNDVNNLDDLDISKRFRSSSTSSEAELYSDDNWTNLELAEEEWSIERPKSRRGKQGRFGLGASPDRRNSVVGAKANEVYSRYADDFQEKNLLGEGAFGRVTKVRQNIDKQLYAIKRVALPDSQAEVNKILLEVTLLPRLFHRHIVRYYHSWIENQPGSSFLYMQMEYCSGQSLLKAIESGHLHNNHELVWRLFTQIVDAVSYLHDNDILHRDLKPANVFLDRERADAKVGDFGLSRYQSMMPVDSSVSHTLGRNTSANTLFNNDPLATRDMSVEVGTMLYTAPEVSTTKYNEKADIWSLGVVLFEMFHRPFPTRMQRVHDIVALPQSGPPEDWGAPDNAKKILSRMVCFSPIERFSAKELKVSDLLPSLTHNPDQDVVERMLLSLNNPHSTECGIFLNAISNRKENEAKDVGYTREWTKHEGASDSDASLIFREVCSTHQASYIDLPILCVQTNLENNGDPLGLESQNAPAELGPRFTPARRHQLLDTQCNTMTYLRTSLIAPFRQSSVNKNEDHVRRCHVGPIYVRRRLDAFGHPVPRAVAILGFWDKASDSFRPQISDGSSSIRFESKESNETFHTHKNELLLAALEVLAGLRIELRLSWPWLLPMLLNLEPTNEWIPKDMRKDIRKDMPKGKKEAKAAINAYWTMHAANQKIKKPSNLDSIIEGIQYDALDKLSRLKSTDERVQEALETVAIVTPFVDKVVIDPLCEGLNDEDGFQDFFFSCRFSNSSSNTQKQSVFCKGGHISNSSHTGTVVQFYLEKLRASPEAPQPQVYVAFHPSAERISKASLIEVAALFWRQPGHCEMLNCSTEQEVRQIVKDRLQETMKKKRNNSSSNVTPVVAYVKDSKNSRTTYYLREVDAKFDRGEVKKVKLEREMQCESKESLVRTAKGLFTSMNKNRKNNYTSGNASDNGSNSKRPFGHLLNEIKSPQ